MSERKNLGAPPQPAGSPEEIEKRDNFFSALARRYECAGVVEDSIVRRAQEKEITDNLEAGTPVLLRGNTRVGKTSMAYALTKHHFGDSRTIRESVDTIFTESGETFEMFRKQFGLSDVANYIAGHEGHDLFEEEWRIREEIEKSGREPYEYLSEYLDKKGERVYVNFDEVIAWRDDTPKLHYLADLSRLKNIRVAIVLHRFAPYEDRFAEIFRGYKTYWMQPLSLEETAKIVRTPLEGSGVAFDDDAIEAIHQVTGGRPMEINLICYALLGPYSGEGLSLLKMRYRKEDIAALVGHTRLELGGVFDHAFRGYRAAYEKTMSDEERTIVDLLAKEGTAPIAQIERRKIQPLLDTMFVRETDDGRAYELNGDLIKKEFRW